MSRHARPTIAGHSALLVSVHLSPPLKARTAGNKQKNDGLIVELARRYAHDYDPRSSTYDFIELALAAGLKAHTTMEYTVKRISPRYYIGSGQLEDVVAHAKAEGAELVAVSIPLSPVHQRNWEQELGLPVLSRHDLILSIFDQNAITAEGKLQVELARLRYELPRIVGGYEQLDPLAGGIGTLGPGEQLTERIKRRHRDRIHRIEKRVEKLRTQRALRRRQRSRSGVFIASLVGYTNVGKSTLLNRLTGSSVVVADRYFATLDPAARALHLPGGQRILLTDTVGFLDDLPKELINSFRATLEELEGASLLIHLADASHPRVDAQIEAVRKIVSSIGLSESPELLVFNKCDRADAAERRELAARHPNSLHISAVSGEGINLFLAELSRIETAAQEKQRSEKPRIGGASG